MLTRTVSVRLVPMVLALAMLAVAAPLASAKTEETCNSSKADCPDNAATGDPCAVNKTTTEGDPVRFPGTINNTTGSNPTCVYGRLRSDGVVDVGLSPLDSDFARLERPSTWRNSGERIELAPLQDPRTVSRIEYERTIDDFRRAFAAAEDARQRLAAVQPREGGPDPLDCYFHPWHPGCQDLWDTVQNEHGDRVTAAVQRHLGTAPGGDAVMWRAGDPRGWVIGYLVGKVFDYTWSVGVCLYKADGPDGRGLEGADGMKKFGNCFVEPGIVKVAGGDGGRSPGDGGSWGGEEGSARDLTWTDWFNRDGPGGSGDFETLRDLAVPCTAPSKIECRTIDDRDWSETGQRYTCEPKVGGVCRNSDQSSGRCLNYKVRFLCAD